MTSPLAPPPPTGQPIDRWLFLLWKRIKDTIENTVSSRLLATLGLTVSGDTFISRGITDEATTTALTIDSSGRVLKGVTTAFDISPSGTGQYPVIGSFSATSQFGFCLGYHANDTIGTNFTAIKSRSGTPGTHGIVSSGDQIAGFLFRGDDGVNYPNCASIYALVDGTPGVNQMPGRIIMQVSPAGAAATMVEKFRLASDGTITLGGVSTAPALKVVPVASQDRWATITASSGGNPTLGVSGGKLACSAALVLSQTTLIETSVALTNGAAAAAGTLLNAPAAGNPTKWIPINDNGTTRYIPAW